MDVLSARARVLLLLLLELARHEFRDGVQLDIRSALVNGADLGVTVELFDAEVLGEADAAEQLDALGRDALRDLPPPSTPALAASSRDHAASRLVRL